MLQLTYILILLFHFVQCQSRVDVILILVVMEEVVAKRTKVLFACVQRVTEERHAQVGITQN